MVKNENLEMPEVNRKLSKLEDTQCKRFTVTRKLIAELTNIIIKV